MSLSDRLGSRLTVEVPYLLHPVEAGKETTVFTAVTECLHLLSAVCSRHFLFLNLHPFFGENFMLQINLPNRDKENVDVDYFKTSNSRFHSVLQCSGIAINFIREYLIHYCIKKVCFFNVYKIKNCSLQNQNCSLRNLNFFPQIRGGTTLESLYKQALKAIKVSPLWDTTQTQSTHLWTFRVFSNLCTVYKIKKRLGSHLLHKFVFYLVAGSVRSTI